ncbi:MAG: hypothetical protein Q8O42_10695 [Acidobacteriota bacterium]|nr:hypothetical protein [Acidobacteriota bacterium]
MHVIELANKRTIFEAPGIDGYWSPDSRQVVYRSIASEGDRVSVWNRETKEILRDVIPLKLGDYYSWGRSNDIDTLLTINGWFVSRHGLHEPSEPERIPECPDIGRGARPLLSRDGQRVSVFVSDEIVLRNLRDCSNVVRTGVVGAKADWSSDGRYLAFHTPKQSDPGYDLGVLDTHDSTFRRLSLSGSSLFPSWTDDNALVFRYEGPDYKGFMRADDVLASPSSTAAAPTYLGDHAEIRRQWRGLVPDSGRVVVLLWAAWSAHTAEALAGFDAANLDCQPGRCLRVIAHDPSSDRQSVAAISAVSRLFPSIEAPWAAVRAAGGLNQSPTYLLFADGCLVRRALGAMSAEELSRWVSSSEARGIHRESNCATQPIV